MLSDHERNTLLDVERRFMVGYPELDRCSTTGLHRQPVQPTPGPSGKSFRQITGDALLRVDQTRADGMEIFIPAGRLPTVDRTRRKEKDDE